jgi:hypothetical protein
MNRRSFLLASSCLSFSACGGSKTIMEAPTWQDPITPDNFKDHRQVTHQGGTPGFVCANRWVTTYVGPNVTNFEWNLVAIIANEARKGENCAAYFQANARSTGNTWAAVSEVCDETFGTQTQTLVAHEFDVWAVGPAKKDRVGVHIVLGDAQVMRGGEAASHVVGTDAIRIASSENGRWKTGINFYDSRFDHLIAIPEEALVNDRIPVRIGNRTMYLRLEE